MPVSTFRKGVAVGVASVLLLGLLGTVAAAWLYAVFLHEPPDATAETSEVEGRVTSTSPLLCVETVGAADGSRRTVWCGLVLPYLSSAADIDVGTNLAGTLVEVETDPGSGPSFGVWNCLAGSLSEC